MARPRSAPDYHLLTKVSTWYHVQDETQQAIADRLRLSRPTVTRLLQEAKDLGIVRISVTPPGKLHIDLEMALEKEFGLREAHVVDVDRDESDERVRHQIGIAGAAYLARTITPGETIGLAWGTTISAMVRAVTPLPTTDVRVVQVLGGVGPPDTEAYAGDLVRRLARLLSASPVLLPAPGIVATSAVRNALRNDPHIREALRRLETLDTVYAGVGSLQSNPLLESERALRAELMAAGAVADVALRFIDAQGRPVRTSLDDRLLGMTAAQLKKVPRVVALAGGRDKGTAVRAALRAGIVDVLLTDQLTAKTVLQAT